jgi:hypothetical protein
MVKASVAVEVSENPFISKTPPEVIDVPAPVVPNGPLPLVVELAPNLKVPFAFTVVNPVNVFVPESVTDVPEAPPTLTTFAKEVAVEFVVIPSEILRNYLIRLTHIQNAVHPLRNVRNLLMIRSSKKNWHLNRQRYK